MLFSKGYSKNHVSIPDLLPLFHSTTGSAFDSIIETNFLDSESDESRSLFFFYGKPSYSYRGHKGRHYSFAFIIKTSDACGGNNFIRMYCFDSGGIRAGYYEPHINRRCDKSAFEIGREAADLQKATLEIYSSNVRYFNSLCESEDTFGSYITEHIKSYISLVRQSSDMRKLYFYDPPAHTFEVQLKSPLDLHRSAIALVAPQSQLMRRDVQEYMYRNDIEPVPFRSERTVGRASTWLAILDSTKRYLREEGLM